MKTRPNPIRPRHEYRNIYRAALGFALAFGIQPEATMAVDIAVVYTPQKSYKLAAAALEAALDRNGIIHIDIEIPLARKDPARKLAIKKIVDARPKLIAAAGNTATLIALRTIPNVPVVFFMVPNVLDAPFLDPANPHKERLAGVPADVAPARQLKCFSALHARGKTLGLLYSPRTRRTARALSAEAMKAGGTLLPIQADKDRFADAVEAINAKHCDGVIMIPDSGVYNSANVQRLLLWGVRQKKPVWAFSASIVKAGAIGSKFVTPDQVGQQAVEIVKKILSGTPPVQIGLQYPSKVDGAVNMRTAEIIGLSFSDAVLGSGITRYGVKQ